MLEDFANALSIVVTEADITDLPFTVIEPALDFQQPLMTFLMWTVFPLVIIPAAIHDYIVTNNAAAACKSQYGEAWEAFSAWAATGRNDLMGIFSTERTCYNPT